MGVGMPGELWLREFGEYVGDAFGEMAYHVGSSLRQKDGWRDVDVRVMLDDETYAALGYGDPQHPQESKKWVATMMAWSAFGRHLTGLPIDFQVQQLTYANATFHRPEQQRSALFALRRIVRQSPAASEAGCAEAAHTCADGENKNQPPSSVSGDVSRVMAEKLATVQRYEMVWASRCGQTFEELVMDADGEWVRYDDVLSALSSSGSSPEHKS